MKANKTTSKQKELILYLIFGILTTLVNFIAFWLIGLCLGEGLYLVTNVIAWAIAVAFAYATNKLFVFEARSFSPAVLAKEIPEFVLARALSLGIEELGLWLLVSVIGLGSLNFSLFSISLNGQMIAKIILAVIVVILNYFFSKFVIFKRKSNSR